MTKLQRDQEANVHVRRARRAVNALLRLERIGKQVAERGRRLSDEIEEAEQAVTASGVWYSRINRDRVRVEWWRWETVIFDSNTDRPKAETNRDLAERMLRFDRAQGRRAGNGRRLFEVLREETQEAIQLLATDPRPEYGLVELLEQVLSVRGIDSDIGRKDRSVS